VGNLRSRTEPDPEAQPGFAERDDEPTTEQTGGGVDPDESATSDQNPPDEGGADQDEGPAAA